MIIYKFSIELDDDYLKAYLAWNERLHTALNIYSFKSKSKDLSLKMHNLSKQKLNILFGWFPARLIFVGFLRATIESKCLLQSGDSALKDNRPRIYDQAGKKVVVYMVTCPYFLMLTLMFLTTKWQ